MGYTIKIRSLKVIAFRFYILPLSTAGPATVCFIFVRYQLQMCCAAMSRTRGPVALRPPDIPLCSPTTVWRSHNHPLLALASMSHTHPTAASSSSPNFQLILNNALDTYKKRTGNDLLAHPLTAQLQTCSSPTSIIAVLQQQVQGLDQSLNTNERWTRWLDPTVNVLYAFSNTLGAGVSLVCIGKLIGYMPSHIYAAGILPCEHHLCRSWGPPFSVYTLVNFTWALVENKYFRQPKTFEQATTHLSTFLSESKCSSSVLRYTRKCRR